MPNDSNRKEDVYVDANDEYGTKLRSKPIPPKNIGIDINDTIIDNIINAGLASSVDISKIESFNQVSQNRESMYQLLDTMAEDSTISAILETYAEDATEPNDAGQIVWAQSDDEKVGKYVQYLLDSMNIDKHIYGWVYSLCKYGDLYLRLYRESEYEQDLVFDDPEITTKKPINEDVKVKYFSKDDKYVHYIEKISNPAEMFELTRYGKSYAYIQASPYVAQVVSKNDSIALSASSYMKYNFNRKDVSVYQPTTFVHAYLEDNSSRVPEEVEIFSGSDEEDSKVYSYTVRRGQSLLYNNYKTWRNLMLLENSLLLNRLTKSSILRVIGVEVGDMPKEAVAGKLMGIKNLIEQKASIDTGSGINEYTNPGPMENNIYIPIYNGHGAITTEQIGGDVDVKGIADIDSFRNNLFAGFRVPKQYFNQTEDSTGFNGGTSLSIISSRYAKMIKRIQNTMIQCITDAINLILIDKNLDSYINRFQIHMLPPTTQEDLDRRDNTQTKVDIIDRIMGLLAEVENPLAKLKAVKVLLSEILTDTEFLNIIQEEIDRLEAEAENEQEEENSNEDEFSDDENFTIPSTPDGFDEFNSEDDLSDITNSETSVEETPEEKPERSSRLPKPSELGAGDFSDANLEF